MGIYRGWKPGSAYRTDQRSEQTTERGPAPVHLRKAQPAVALLPRTVAWIASLPEADRPHALAKQYARIANIFATLWSRPEECRRYFDELLIDRRRGRKGFPADVVQDIMKLRQLHAHLFRSVDPAWQIPRR